LLTDLESQLPTRRYVNFLLKDLHVLTAIKLSPLYKDSEDGLIRDLHALLEHYVHFSIDDISGLQLSQEEVRQLQNSQLAKLQHIAFRDFKDKMLILALANYGSIGQRNELVGHVAELSDDELVSLCERLRLRTSYPKAVRFSIDRPFLTEAVLSVHERRRTFQEQAKSMAVSPNEHTLFQESFIRDGNYDGFRPLAVPKLNLQYLTVGDFLWRTFHLYRHEAFYGIRRDIEDSLQKMSPKIKYPSMETSFHGFSKMALTINHPS
jgi:intron-binding protein aquarius